MKHPNAISLAKRLLDSHLKRNRLAGTELDPCFQISDEELAWAEDILATRLDACIKQGLHPDLTEAVEDALAFALRHEKAYEPSPTTSRWHVSLLMLDEVDADHKRTGNLTTKAVESSATLQAKDDILEQRLAKAHANRELMGVLIDENWLGLKLLAFLRSSSPMIAAELAAATGAPLDEVRLALYRLKNFKAIQSLALPPTGEQQCEKFTCLELGAKLLSNLELSTGIDLTPSDCPSVTEESQFAKVQR